MCGTSFNEGYLIYVHCPRGSYKDHNRGGATRQRDQQKMPVEQNSLELGGSNVSLASGDDVSHDFSSSLCTCKSHHITWQYCV